MIHSVTKIRVRYAETDRMDVVYHSNYLVWFEAARIQMLDEIGIPYREIEERGLFLPVLTVSATYKSPARFDDRLEVHLFMKEKPRGRIHFDYEVLRQGERLALGQSSHGFMDRRGKGHRPPEDLLARIESAWASQS
jgi:acyl-CoA thioester hydrolase